MKQLFIPLPETSMYNQYRSTNRATRVVAAAAALVTVWWLFDSVALLGDVQTVSSRETRAAAAISQPIAPEQAVTKSQPIALEGNVAQS